MLLTPEQAAAFHCPRWAELPGIPLYMDQVILVLEDSLALFAEEDGHFVTATMINNYVKQKIIIPPGGKRYGREQLATLVMVCLMKKVFSISETIALIGLLTENTPLSEAYDLFCAELEHAIARVFADPSGEARGIAQPAGEAGAARHAAVAALTGKLHAQGILAARQERERSAKEQIAKEKKTEGKK